MALPFDNVLVIRFSSVGDILLSSLLLRVFRKRFPECRLDYLVKREYADLVRYNPHLTNIIEFSDETGDLRALRRRIANDRYDLIIDIHDSLRSRYVCFGRKNVVRLNKRKLARFLLVRTKRNFYPRLGGAPSVAERYLEPVLHLGVRNDGVGLEMFITEEHQRRAKSLTSNIDRQFIGIAPGAVHANKIWSGEGFADTAVTLARENQAGILILGSVNDMKQGRDVEKSIQEKDPRITVINTTGTTSLTDAAALMDHCSVLLTNDSGLMHMAAARKRKVVAVFGPTVREFGFLPYGTESIIVERTDVPCRPCTHIGLPNCPEKHFRCMTEITSDMVSSAARKLLAE